MARFLLVVLCCAGALLALAAGAQALTYYAANLPNHERVGDATVSVTNPLASTAAARLVDSSGTTLHLSLPPQDSVEVPLSDRIDGTRITDKGTYRIETGDRATAQLWTPIGNEASNDMTVLWSLGDLGREYYTHNPMSHHGCPDPCRSFITIVATSPGTTVHVTPTAAILPGGGVPAIPAGTTWSTTLGELEALNLESEGDLTGSHVVAAFRVAVWSGAVCPTQMYDAPCEHVSDQILPVAAGGTSFIVCNPLFKEPMRIEVVALEPGDTMVWGGLFASQKLTGPGDSFWLFIDTHTTVIADQRIQVVVYMDTWTGADPGKAMARVPPIAGYEDTYDFYAVDGTADGGTGWSSKAYYAHRVNVTPRLDGALLPAAPEKVWDNNVVGLPDEYECTPTPVAAGTHQATADGPIAVLQFAHDRDANIATHLMRPEPTTVLNAVLDANGCLGLIITVRSDIDVTGGTLRYWSGGVLYVDERLPAGYTGGNYPAPVGAPTRVELVLDLADGSQAVLIDDDIIYMMDNQCTASLSLEPVPLGTCRGGEIMAVEHNPQPGSSSWLSTTWTVHPPLPHHASKESLRWDAGVPPGTYTVTARAAFEFHWWSTHDVYWESATTELHVISCTSGGGAGAKHGNVDADGDGVIDRHDNCPMVANAGSQGAGVDCGVLGIDEALGLEEEVPEACPVTLPEEARAKRMPDETVRIRWSWAGSCPDACGGDGPEGCQDVRFAVWNGTAGTELVAVVAYRADGMYEAWNVAPWGGAHRYEVQVLHNASGEDVLHDLRAVRPTDLVAPCHCPLIDGPVDKTTPGNDDQDHGGVHDGGAYEDAVASGRDVPLGLLVPLVALMAVVARRR